MQRELWCILQSWERPVHILKSQWVTVFGFCHFCSDSWSWTVVGPVFTSWGPEQEQNYNSLFFVLVSDACVTSNYSRNPYSKLCPSTNQFLCVCRERRGRRATEETRKTASEKVTLEGEEKKVCKEIQNQEKYVYH